MTRVLVTGGAGFLGSHLVDALVAAGHAVHVLDNHSTGSAFNLMQAHQRGARTTAGSVAWRPDVERVFERFRPEVVYHLAAQIDVTRSVDQPVEDAITNVQGTINVLDACARTDVRRFLLASSAAVYGHNGRPVTENTPYQPIAPYGASKVAAQGYAEMYDRLGRFRGLLADDPAKAIPAALTAVTVLFGNLYGPRQREGCGLINITARALLRGEPVTLYGDGRNVRDYVHVDDAVRVLLDAGDLDQRQSPFTVSRRILVGTGIGTTDRAVWDLVADAVERTGTETLDVDKHLRYAPARPGDIRSSVLPAHHLATMPPRIGVRSVVEAIRKELKL